MSVPAELIHAGMTLQTLMQDIVDAPPIAIGGIATDSRQLRYGDVFLARAGGRSHGLDFIEQAMAAGVAAVIYDSDTATGPGVYPDVPIIGVPALAQHIGTLADRWFSSPSKSIAVTGVTGTNGKTTVALMLAQCLQLLGQRCGYIGTLGKGIDELDSTNGLTTPASLDLHRILAEFRSDRATHAAIEVSSHGLSQGRVDGVRFNSAMFTNLSRDHIDYHGDMQKYFDEKARLFLDGRSAAAVINVDSEFGQDLASRCKCDVTVVSTQSGHVANGQQFVIARSIVTSASGSRVRFDSSWGSSEIDLGLPGTFNIENALLVLAEMLRGGQPMDKSCSVLAAVKAPAGRMQRVEHPSQAKLPAVYVDYAHTPAGLESALRALRSHCRGDLWCVFGCGGDRDSGKRSQMGDVVSRLAARAIVTSDNPRSENPAGIIDDIRDGMSGDEIVIEDRAAAIAYAIRQAADADTILIAGKGHEEIQIVGERSILFSDYGAAHANLRVRHDRSADS